MKNLSLRLRYLASYLVLLGPILIFAFVLYFSTVNRSVQYTNAASLTQFTYAAENISSILNRLDDSARSALSLEDQLQANAYGGLSVKNDDSIRNILSTMEERLSPSVDLLFYLRGDTAIYTADGKRPYNEWEKEYTAEYNLPMSKLFSSMLTFDKASILPLCSASNPKSLVGLAYLVPFPTIERERASAALIYLLHSSILQDEFANYIGEIQGDLFVYDDKYKLLFNYQVGQEPLLSMEDIAKVRGVGLQEIKEQGKSLVLMRVSDSNLGLHCVLVLNSETFYADLRGTQRIMVMLIVALIVIICVLAIWTTFFNYKPINDLVTHVTGWGKSQALKRNELEVIKSYYDRSISEAEELSMQLSELMPIVAQQFVNKLIFGKIASREEFDQLSRSADILFTRPYSAALYIILPARQYLGNSEGDLERCALVISRFHPAQCLVAYGELPAENALCAILNFACDQPDQAAAQSMEYARQLSQLFSEAGLPMVRIGVGCAYQDPLQMPESFAEASATVQLAPPSRDTVFSYEPHASDTPRNPHEFPGVSGMSMALLTEGIHRGEKSVAARALHDILEEITAVTDSFVYFRFYCAELLAAMIRQANTLNIRLEQSYLDSLIVYASQAEFTEKSFSFLEYLCDEVRARIQREDDQMKRRVMDYILENYTRFDLSIQMVSDALGIRKSQITALLKEDTGQNFVQYVSYLRMNEFKRLLLETSLTIQECVNQIGYSDVPNFLRKFKSIEGVTPGQYRVLHSKAE